MISLQKPEKPAEDKTCNCRNSKCMKLYCECFSAGQECNKNCRCTDCRNQKDGDFQLNRILPNAFSLKTPKHEGSKESRGCSCRKSFCIKKYCQCFQDGVLCSENCKCIQCQNNELMTNRNLINRLRKTESNSSNKYCSLFPIIISQSADHIQHLISEENSLNLDEREVEEGMSGLFATAQEGQAENIIQSFINILKKIDNKVKISEMDMQLKESIQE